MRNPCHIKYSSNMWSNKQITLYDDVMCAGEGAVAVARSGRQRTFAPNTEWTQIHFDHDGLFLQVGGGCAHAVVPPPTGGDAHRGRHHTLWIPTQDPLQTAPRHSPQSECVILS